MKMLDLLQTHLKKLKNGEAVDEAFRGELVSLLEWCHKDVSAAIQAIKKADAHYLPLLVALAQGPAEDKNLRCNHNNKCTRDRGHSGWHLAQKTAEHWPPPVH